MVKIKRVYEPVAKGDGYRVFVDRLWPRGLKKSELKYDEWPKDICPSPEIRKSFAHEASRFAQFRRQYKTELHRSAAQRIIHELAEKATRGTVTLLYAAHDERINHAVILKEEIERAQQHPMKELSPS